VVATDQEAAFAEAAPVESFNAAAGQYYTITLMGLVVPEDWEAVIDTHLSVMFTAVVLYVVGNDQLKGFGISLCAGLAISLFTSLYMMGVRFDETWSVLARDLCVMLLIFGSSGGLVFTVMLRLMHH
jgi:hypothetical protein